MVSSGDRRRQASKVSARTFPLDLALSQTGHQASLLDAVDPAAAGSPDALLDLDLLGRSASCPREGQDDGGRPS
jgi:hypothetical protein